MVVWQGAYEGPKVVYFFVGSFLLFIYWIFKVLKDKESFRFARADLFYFLWLGTLLISSVLGVHPLDSILGGSYRHQGVLFFLSLWVLGKTTGLLKVDERKLFTKSIGIVVVVESLVALLQVLGGQTFWNHPLGTMGETNALAGYLAIASTFLSEKILILIVGLILLTTRSVSGIGAFLVAKFYTLSRYLKKRTLYILIIVLLGGLFVVGYHSILSSGAYLFAPKTSIAQIGQEDRLVIWRVSLDNIIQKPFLGWGCRKF